MDEPVKKYRLAVIGSRGYTDKERIFKILDANKHQIKLIVSGGCKGPDTIAQEWCKNVGMPLLIFYPQTTDPETGLYDKGGFFRRNRQIVEQSQKILAFWDQISKGTKMTIEMAETLGKPVKIVDVSTKTKHEPDSNMGRIEHDDKGDN